MADRVDISATVRAIDQASGPLRSIASQIKSVGDIAKTAGGSLARLATQPFGSVSKNLQGVGSAVKGLAGNFKALWSPLGALIGVGGFAGAVAAVKEYVGELNNLRRVSRRTGASIQTIEGLSLMTGDAEKASNSLTMLTRGLARLAAAKKVDPRLVQILGKMGISLADVRSGAISTDEVLAKLATGFAKNTKNITSMNWVAQQLAGKAGKDLIDILARGPEELARWTAEAAKRINVDDAMVQRGRALGEAQRFLGASIRGLRLEVVDALQPALLGATKWLDEFIIAHKPQIVTALSDAIKTLGRWMGNLWKAIEVVVGAVGGWENAFALLQSAIAIKLLPDVLNLGKELLKLAGSVVFNPLTLGALAFAGVAATVRANWGTIGPWLEANLPPAAQRAFTAVANWAQSAQKDIVAGWKRGGLVGAITAGVISAGKAIYQNWGEISQWLEETFPAISAAAKTAWGDIKTWWSQSVQNIKTAWEQGGLLAAMEATWAAAKVGATGMWNFIRDESGKIKWDEIGKMIGDAVKAGWQLTLTGFKWLETAADWNTIGKNIGTFIADAIKALFGTQSTEFQNSIIEAFKGIGKSAVYIGVEIAKGIIEGLWEGLGGKAVQEWVQGLHNQIRSAFGLGPRQEAPTPESVGLPEGAKISPTGLVKLPGQLTYGSMEKALKDVAEQKALKDKADQQALQDTADAVGKEIADNVVPFVPRQPLPPGAATAAIPPLAPAQGPPVAQPTNVLQGMKEIPVRLAGEIAQRLKIDMSPDLRAMLQENKTRIDQLGVQIRSGVDVGVTMGPAMGEAA